MRELLFKNSSPGATWAGIAYSIIDSPNAKIKISDGFLYEQGKLADVRGPDDVYQAPRNPFRLSYHFSIRERVFLDGTHFFQPSIKDISDYIITSTSRFSVKMKKWLSITASVLYNEMTPTRRQNLLISYGIAIDQYF